MSPVRFLSASLLLAFGLPLAAAAQTAGGGPVAPAPPGLGTTPHPTAKHGATLPAAKMQPLPKPTAAEQAEKRKIDHDLHICIGC